MNKIAILDYGSQYTHLLATRVRRLGVYSEILDNNTPAEKLAEYKGIILSGGPSSVYEENSPSVDPKVFELGIPILGVCYGHQLMTHLLGGKVEAGKGVGAEFGKADIEVFKNEGIFKNFLLGAKTQVWMSHGDKVTKLPDGFEIIASSKDDAHSAVADLKRNFFGIQFHAEVLHTIKGNEILKNFLDICGAKRDWDLSNFIEDEVSKIQKQVGDKKVFLLISGGVDSTVAFLLLAKALGQENIYALYVDTGFMRANETEQVKAALGEIGITNLHIYDAKLEFYTALEGVIEPEKKREVIGRVFLEIQKKVSVNLNLNPEEWMIAQGTIYPDTIESGGTKNSAKIKTHHNRVPEIEELIRQGKIIEPIKELYKDEVREIGMKLGLHPKMVWRHPFPGPGLAVRILCAAHEDWAEDHEKLESEINDFILDLGYKLKAYTLPIKSVGVQGDFRTYRHPLLLSGTATWQELAQLAPALTNKFSQINRVLYALTPIEKFSVTFGTLSEERVQRLQHADKLAMDFIYKNDPERTVWQMPTVLLPLSANEDGKESIVLRPIMSEEAMTANFAELDLEKVKALAKEILIDKNISAVFYDITNKPPATIEWE